MVGLNTINHMHTLDLEFSIVKYFNSIFPESILETGQTVAAGQCTESVLAHSVTIHRSEYMASFELIWIGFAKCTHVAILKAT